MIHCPAGTRRQPHTRSLWDFSFSVPRHLHLIVFSSPLLGALRGPSGVWRQVQVRAPTGEDLPLYISEDQSPRMVRQSVLSQTLVKCLREVHDDRQFFFQRTAGTISSSWRAVARVVCATKEGEPQIEWNAAVVGDFGVDKQRVKAVFEAGLAAGAPEEVRWGP